MVIISFTGFFSNLNLFVGHRGLKLQNKMDFREIFRSMCLMLDNTAASQHILSCVKNHYNIMLIIRVLCHRIFKSRCW